MRYKLINYHFIWSFIVIVLSVQTSFDEILETLFAQTRAKKSAPPTSRQITVTLILNKGKILIT